MTTASLALRVALASAIRSGVPPGRAAHHRHPATQQREHVTLRGAGSGELEGHLGPRKLGGPDAPPHAAPALGGIHDRHQRVPARLGHRLDLPSHPAVADERELHAGTSSKNVRCSRRTASPSFSAGKTAATLVPVPPRATISGSHLGQRREHPLAHRPSRRRGRRPRRTGRPVPWRPPRARRPGASRQRRLERRALRHHEGEAAPRTTPRGREPAPPIRTPASTRGRNPGSTRMRRPRMRARRTRRRGWPPRPAAAASAPASRSTTVPAASGFRVLRTRTGISAATAGAMEAGCSTLAP